MAVTVEVAAEVIVGVEVEAALLNATAETVRVKLIEVLRKEVSLKYIIFCID